MRVYHAYLSQESFEKIMDACDIVGVSGDNTFEKSVAHQVLPYYNSTNSGMKRPTFTAILTLVNTVDFGFSDKIKRDLNVYFSDQSIEGRVPYWKELMQVNLDSIKAAWPTIAAYLKEHRNFYNLCEALVLMPAPAREALQDGKEIKLLTSDCNQHFLIAGSRASCPPSKTLVSEQGFFAVDDDSNGDAQIAQAIKRI